MEHLLGTDGNGRDLLSRIIVGSRLSFAIAIGTVALGGVIGVTAGLAAGLRGGWLDVVFGRLADIQQSIPFIILALAVVGVLVMRLRDRAEQRLARRPRSRFAPVLRHAPLVTASVVVLLGAALALRGLTGTGVV